MKMYKCKIKGAVDTEGCYTCFMTTKDEREYPSRVLCKTANIVEEMEVVEEVKVVEEETPMKEEVPVGEEVSE